MALGCSEINAPAVTASVTPRRRRKVLHIVGGMNRGGVETWLMHVLRNTSADEYETHFLVNTDREGAYDKEIRELGGQVHYGGRPDKPATYARQFAAVARTHGPFDVLHTHVYWYSGFNAYLGFRAGIPIRVAHSHTAVSAPMIKVHRRLYQSLMRGLLSRYATHRLAVSQKAGEMLFGRSRANQFRILYYGMDYSRFERMLPQEDAKRRLGIPPERKVVGHIGRFVPVKNHAFILSAFRQLLARGEDMHLLLVGEGPLYNEIANRLKSENLSDRCTLTGSQSDVVPFFSAMNILLLPSLWEGLPLVTLECQAAGVPLLASTVVPPDITVVPELVTRLELSSGGDQWASAILQILEEQGRGRSGNEAAALTSSRFGLPACLATLHEIYSTANLNRV